MFLLREFIIFRKSSVLLKEFIIFIKSSVSLSKFISQRPINMLLFLSYPPAGRKIALKSMIPDAKI